jgi:hypothetical protein
MIILTSVHNVFTDQLVSTKTCDKHIELGNGGRPHLVNWGTRRWSSEMMKQLSILVYQVRGAAEKHEGGWDGWGRPDCATRRQPTTGSRVRRPEVERRGGTRFGSAGSGNRGRQDAEEGVLFRTHRRQRRRWTKQQAVRVIG